MENENVKYVKLIINWTQDLKKHIEIAQEGQKHINNAHEGQKPLCIEGFGRDIILGFFWKKKY